MEPNTKNRNMHTHTSTFMDMSGDLHAWMKEDNLSYLYDLSFLFAD